MSSFHVHVLSFPTRYTRAWLVVAVILAAAADASAGEVSPVRVETTVHKVGDSSSNGGVILITLARRGEDEQIWIGGAYERGERKNTVIVSAIVHAHGEKTKELKEVLARQVILPEDKGLRKKEDQIRKEIDMISEALSQYWGAGEHANKKDEL
jgi:hypothetical protein